MARLIESLAQDLQLAARSLRRSTLFTIASVLTLALGIAAATTVFSLVDGILIEPLPFAHAGRLVDLVQRDAQGNSGGVSYPNLQDWQRQASAGTFAGLAFARGRHATLATAEGPESFVVAIVSPGFFDVLDERPMLGRSFTAAEERDGGHVVVLAYDAWRDQFHGDQRIVGRSITLSDGIFTVIGVMPRGVTYPDFGTGIYLPIAAFAATEKALTARGLHVDSRAFARLAPGVTVQRAELELSGIANRLAAAYPEADKDWPSVQLLPMRERLLGDASSSLTILSVAVGLVLLIAWVNVTNLSLVRAAGRSREWAIRTSLGASRRRITGQLLTESFLLSLVGGAVGALASIWVVDLVKHFASATLPRLDTVVVNGRALAFTTGLVFASTIAVGFLPALRVARNNLTDTLKESSAGAGTSGRQQRMRGALVVGEIGFALALVIAAGLLIKSFWRLSTIDPGFDTHHLVAIDLSPPGTRALDPAQTALYFGRLLSAARQLPGVQQAALTNHLPLSGAWFPTHVEMPGRAADPEHNPQVLFRTISPEYLTTMRIPLHRGRALTEADLQAGPAVLVNEAFVAEFWPGEDPLGRSVTLHESVQGRPNFGEPFPGTVVGVVGDVRHEAIQKPSVPEIYIPYTRDVWGHMVVVVRATGDAKSLVPSLRRALLGVDPSLSMTGGALGGFQTVDDLRSGGLLSQRLNMMLLGGFGLCALVLSAIGIYGLMAYAVAQRTREIGIRLALGAQARNVSGLILGSGFRLIGLGVALGLAGAFALTRLASGLLFGVAPTDPATFIAMTAILASVAGVACYIPARRATRVDPVTALRNE